ncbi:YeeE/YedE thiosulfate transporter family protein [uncultured Pseudodesulfovibrio sp.]|uniref:YeeE/YedE thiosulfate transporter family protein n=1 Tax=uncultured Pseudodesulfovibrio sp. TaxID=2035858 RepID=UPI0029C61D3A|nr:YeeE/YedE thiosulfate transporter family protein [uncultured Pseudodesulfovibrio sp.]
MKSIDKGMNPYLAGALTGVLLALSVLLVGKYFGASTSYVRSVGLLEMTLAPQHVQATDYFMKYFAKEGGIDWQWLFVLGIFFGSYLSANFSSSYNWNSLPEIWQARYGARPGLRFILAFVGGAIALFGARMAGGCPSGHGLSGMAQVTVSGTLAMVAFFVGGVVTAKLLYGGK